METGIGIIFLIFGLSSTLAGILLFRNVYAKMRTWKTVSGTVVGYKEYENQQANRSTSSFCPQVQFTTDEGKMIAFTSSNGSSRRPYRIGATVKVLCPPGDPAKATIKSFSNLCILPIVAVVFGVAFALIGLDGVFVKGR
jgi:hypothetical protein